MPSHNMNVSDCKPDHAIFPDIQRHTRHLSHQLDLLSVCCALSLCFAQALLLNQPRVQEQPDGSVVVAVHALVALPNVVRPGKSFCNTAMCRGCGSCE